MDRSHKSKRVSEAGKTLLATVIVALGGWHSGASAAATTEIECDSVVRDIRTLDTPLESLSASPVDHVSIDARQPENALLDASEDMSETAAPFLYLTPRVASVLRDIFDATRSDLGESGKNDVVSSPVAESDVVLDVSRKLNESESAADNQIDLPLFQQRMFRTDI